MGEVDVKLLSSYGSETSNDQRQRLPRKGAGGFARSVPTRATAIKVLAPRWVSFYVLEKVTAKALKTPDPSSLLYETQV